MPHVTVKLWPGTSEQQKNPTRRDDALAEKRPGSASIKNEENKNASPYSFYLFTDNQF